MTNLIERSLRYQRVHGTRKLIREGLAKVKRRIWRVLGWGAPAGGAVRALLDDSGWINAREMADKHLPNCTALRLFTIPAATVPRVSLVTDSINKGSLYGGVGTAIIMASLIAQAQGARLRIVTRTESAQPSNLASMLSTYGIELSQEVEFSHAPFSDSSYEIDVFAQELFITTSWWTTAATMASVRHESILYLLQEDERMFYPYGDEHLRCSRVLRSENIHMALNTKLLFDHLVASGLPNVARHGIWFEPAFPRDVFFRREVLPGKRRTLMFYARPNNLRNLFYFGLDVLETAIGRGIVKLDEWDIVLVGKDIPRIRLDDGRYTPRRLENMSWQEYAALTGAVDLGLCLMYTPHPSYPPFDMAASGAVVVTNRFANKQDLSGYSQNILCGDLEIDSMLQVLAQGVLLAADTPRREANHRANRLGTDWRESFARVVERFGKPA